MHIFQVYVNVYKEGKVFCVLLFHYGLLTFVTKYGWYYSKILSNFMIQKKIYIPALQQSVCSVRKAFAISMFSIWIVYFVTGFLLRAKIRKIKML